MRTSTGINNADSTVDGRSKGSGDDEEIINLPVARRLVGSHNDATNQVEPARGTKSGRRHVPVASGDPGAANQRQDGRSALKKIKVAAREAFGAPQIERSQVQPALTNGAEPASLHASTELGALKLATRKRQPEVGADSHGDAGARAAARRVDGRCDRKGPFIARGPTLCSRTERRRQTKLLKKHHISRRSGQVTETRASRVAVERVQRP